MLKENIFSALSRYNSAVDENYLTESFVYVLKYLLESEEDRSAGLDLLNFLSSKDGEPEFQEDENIIISTQYSTKYGQPDIRIKSSDKLIYIENKDYSGLRDRQIQRYKKALEDSNASIKHVILVSRFSVDFEDKEATPYKHIRWYQIYNNLFVAELNSPVSKYIISSFLTFLEEKQMSIQKVGWEYIKGVPAFLRLIDMIGLAIEDASLPLLTQSGRAGLDYRGYYLKDKEFFCGVYYEEYLAITFQIEDKAKVDKSKITALGYRFEEDNSRIYIYLDLESIHFFSLNKDDQLKEISTFLKKSYETAKGMEISNE